ncbi:MAG: DeoR/GlpR family DNA-binding transcription regulator [Lachnospiraceae bacterium]|nr:DeoR/GlpR family DNA-binding transcription regulator [Lachnospiraceae bacterium]
MLALERRNLILEQLQEEKKVVVSELATKFNVSEETIRRDLDKLDRDGLAVKSYGGAIINENTSIDMPFNVRKKKNVAGKQKMAEIIAGLIEDGDHITLDASTTAIFIAKAIKQKQHLTIVTNSIEVIIELSDVSDWNIISSGGRLKEGYLALVGSDTIGTFNNYNVEKAIISGKGFDLQKGLTDSSEEFAQPKQMMLRSAQTKIVVVDHSKFDKVAFSRIADLGNIDIVVTDERPSEAWIRAFRDQGIRLYYPN